MMDKGTRVDKILQGAILVRERDLWGHGDGNGTLKKIQWSGIYFSSSTDIPYVSINSIKFLFLKRMKMVMVIDTTCKAGMLIQCLMWPRWEVPPLTGPNGTARMNFFFFFFFNIKTQIVIETD